MGWEVYNRARRTDTADFRSEFAKYNGWLRASSDLHPTDAWLLRKAMKMPCATSQLGGQLMRLAMLKYRHTMRGPRPAPNITWALDQDRRCKGEDWPLTL